MRLIYYALYTFAHLKGKTPRVHINNDILKICLILWSSAVLWNRLTDSEVTPGSVEGAAKRRVKSVQGQLRG